MSKILINLHSEQTIPNYVAIKELKPDVVYALATNKFKYQIDVFEEVTNVKHEYVPIDAYDIEKNFRKITEITGELRNDEIIVNYTGGTKVMVISVVLKILLSISRKLLFVYVNTYGNQLEYLEVSEDKNLSVYITTIKTKIFIEIYTKLKGEKLKSFHHQPEKYQVERFPLSENLLLNTDLRSIFSKQKNFFLDKNVKTTFSLKTDNYELFWNRDKFCLISKDLNYTYNHKDGGVFFSGTWLEEYVFIKLLNSKYFDKVIGNVKFNFTSFKIKDKQKKKTIFKNEIDVVATKGLKTAFIECKAGYVSQDYVYKLSSIRDHFLGTFGKAVLVTMFRQNPNIVEKCKDAGILLISGEYISQIDEQLKVLL